jgi:hypothetical protein
MTVAHKPTIAAFAAALGALVAPAFAQNGSSDMQSGHDRGMRMGHMGQGMMGGCAGMMQSMNNGDDARPNRQWQKRPPETADNGG